MLLCLDREQRLTFILGAIFEVSDTVAAEVLEITPDNFRQRLARARRDLRNFMNDKCGLVNQANTCRCAKKTRGFIQAGYVDPGNLLFVRERICEVQEAAPKVHQTINTLDAKCAEIFRGHPFYKAPGIGPCCGGSSRGRIWCKHEGLGRDRIVHSGDNGAWSHEMSTGGEGNAMTEQEV